MRVTHWVSLKRKEKRLTQSKLADIIMVSQSTISRIETGKLAPNFDIVKNLAKALGYKGKEYSLIDAETREKRTFNIIDQRELDIFGHKFTVLVTDDNCVLEIVGTNKGGHQ